MKVENENQIIKKNALMYFDFNLLKYWLLRVHLMGFLLTVDYSPSEHK